MIKHTFRYLTLFVLACHASIAGASDYDQDAELIARIPPIMPINALHSGYCKFTFTVTKTGKIVNIRTLECNDSIFETASIESLKKWQYAPAKKNGHPVSRKGIETKITFMLSDIDGKPILGPEIPEGEFLYGPNVKSPAKLIKTQTFIRPLKGNLPPPNFCCINYGISQTGRPFNVEAQTCTPKILQSDAEHFIQGSTFLPAKKTLLPVSSTGYSKLIYFHFNKKVSQKPKPVNFPPFLHRGYFPAMGSDDDTKLYCSAYL